LSTSKPGAELLTDLYKQKLLDIVTFDISTAERINNSTPGNPISANILKQAINRDKEKKKAFTGKLSKYMAIAKEEAGNAKKGEMLFQTCLMCHKVGNKGQSIAPALDGSAARENEALLTAILDPDAAVESNYAVYRVNKKDGGNVEGYLVKKDERGTTIAFMGGAQTFVEAEAIKSQGFLGGRSFMMKGLIDNYSDAQVADLLAYIKTLK
jgi:putative heme-binding domain-containing protein